MIIVLYSIHSILDVLLFRIDIVLYANVEWLLKTFSDIESVYAWLNYGLVLNYKTNAACVVHCIFERHVWCVCV